MQIKDLPTFGIGHSLGSVIHLLIGITKIFLFASWGENDLIAAILQIGYLIVDQDQDMLFKEVAMC